MKAEDEAAYLEIHHLRQLAAGGSDTIQNAVVVCPNCHPEFPLQVNQAGLSTCFITVLGLGLVSA
ncbi:TPA: HNH endonuclease [Candidatus Poribacteria bacterium]|nr:HNH endonuclease [Candidatus Poribacteria bacterium]HIA66389.1 HNH endonuclease [Candidatus Poribacteria bacterium]